MIFVTGGTGLVGSYLLFELTKKGERVRVLIRDKNGPSRIEKFFSCLTPDKDHQMSLIEWVEGDILDISALDTALSGIGQVYHCAGLVSFCKHDHARMMKVNSEGTANIVNLCLKHGIRKLIYVSSVAALGQPENGNLVDENSVWKISGQNSGYAISKYSAEREVWRGIEEGLDAVIVNPSVILGAVCHSLTANSLLRNMKRLMPFYSKGINGYVDVRDVVASMILLMDSNISRQRFLISSETLSCRDFFSIGAEILNMKKPFIPVSSVTLGFLWRISSLVSFITGTKPLFTRELARPMVTKTYYSTRKFTALFGYSYIPVRQSLKDAFQILEMLEK